MLLGCRDLPEDVMVDILLRLPVKSLLRFKSVCKPWYVLFTSPNFIKMHLRYRTTNNADTKLLFVNNPVLRWLLENKTPTLTVSNGDDIVCNLPLWTFPFDLLTLRVAGSCNGLLCVQGYFNQTQSLVLLNPATRQFRYLRDSYCLHSWFFLGLGFLPDSHDYKLVAFKHHFRELGKISMLVYTLSSDSWRLTDLIPAPPVSLPLYNLGTPVVLNGFFHWMARVSREQETIVSFDLCDYAFGQMALPDSTCAIGGGAIVRKLVVLKGSLSVIVYSNIEKIDRCFEVWVMTEYGVKESWNKVFTLGPFSSVVHPLGSWKNGEFIFLYLDDILVKLLSYDPSMQKTVYLQVPPNMGLLSLNYVESLESVEGGVQRSSTRFSSIIGAEYSRTQIPYEKAGDGESPSNVLGREFAIPVPEHSNMLHCRLCGKLLLLGVSGSKQCLDCPGRFSPLPYVSSTDIREETVNEHLGLSPHHDGVDDDDDDDDNDNDDDDDDYDYENENFASLIDEIVIQGQDVVVCERRSDSGKDRLERKVSNSLMKTLRRTLGTLMVVLTCR